MKMKAILYLGFFCILPMVAHCSSTPDRQADGGLESGDEGGGPGDGDDDGGGNAEGEGGGNGQGGDEGEQFLNSNEFALDDDGESINEAVSEEGNNLFGDNGDDELFSQNAEEQAQSQDEPFSPDEPASNLAGQARDLRPSELTAEPSTNGAEKGQLQVKPGSAEENFEAFRLHFASFLAGHPEGVFWVKAEKVDVRNGPGDRYAAIGQLKQGDDVHVMGQFGEWAKIGQGQYVLLHQLHSYGIKTKGIEAYQRPSMSPHSPSKDTESESSSMTTSTSLSQP